MSLAEAKHALEQFAIAPGFEKLSVE